MTEEKEVEKRIVDLLRQYTFLTEGMDSETEMSIYEDAKQALAEYEKKKKPKRATRLPDDWQLPDEWGDWAMKYCASKGLPDAFSFIVAQGAEFKNFWVSKPGAGAVKLNWYLTWQNWVRKGLPNYILQQKKLSREESYRK